MSKDCLILDHLGSKVHLKGFGLRRFVKCKNAVNIGCLGWASIIALLMSFLVISMLRAHLGAIVG